MDTVADRRPTLGRLMLVELRKALDTRAGFWLQAAVGALTLLLVVLYCVFADADERTLWDTLLLAVQPASILLSVLGVLLVTSEWSQRTAPITFVLVPRRTRVVAAKVYASVVLSLAAVLVCLPVSAIAVAIAPGSGDLWALPAGALGRVALSVILSMLTGLALGALLLSSAPAIVLSFVLPLVSGGVGSIPHVEPVAVWLDPLRSFAPLTERTMSGLEWAHLGTTLVVWLVLPLAVGIRRIVRGEVQ
jgi:ABC-type transport system involved in multi-copper enzyme maturation permease subunit